MTARDLSAASDADLLADVAAMYDAVDPMPDGVAEQCKAAIATAPYEYTVRRFACPFCRNFSRSKRPPVADHMTRCWRNPAVRACLTCAHFQRELPEPEVGLSGFEWCDAQDVELDGIRDHCPLWALRGSGASERAA